MAYPSEYHICVRLSFSASILFASLLLSGAFVSPSQAQINGAPPSVTSPGFGGRPINGTPPSVTSLGARGFTPGPNVPFPIAPHPLRNGNEHRRHRDNNYAYPLIYAVPIPYAVDNNVVDDSAAEDDSDYQGGPTVFDRRGSGASSYIPSVRDVPPAHSSQGVADPPSDPAPAQDRTVLVFKDGRQLEVGNYAIVGAILIDLTPGHSRKIAIADLDLDATRKQNENRGVIFQLPPSLQSD